jgi:hypothetical protein
MSSARELYKSLRFPRFLLLKRTAIFSRRHSAPIRGDLIRAVAVSDHFYLMGWRHPSRPTESFSKQARTLLYIGPGHFDSIQSFSKQLDLSILGNQPRKEELMNSSSRFA